MSLLTSLSSGTSGLSSASSELSVISDNLANSNTVGFKASRAAFEDALAQSVVGGPGTIGLGSHLQAVQRLETQGALSNTGNATDLALEGPGFFLVRGTVGGRTANYYTRAGQFTVDKDGYLSNLDGLRVQGFGADAAGTVTSSFGDLRVGNATSQPRATNTITLRTNLQADAATTGPFVAANANATSNFSSSVTVFDSLGSAHQVQVFFTKTGAGAWQYNAVTDAGGLTGGTPGTPTVVAQGALAFDASGKLTSVTPAAGFSFDPAGAAQGQPLTFQLGDPTAAGGTGLAGITQFAAPSSTSFIGQDGWSAGELAQVQIDKTGVIQGVFTNGQSRSIGQVGIASFSAPDQLERMGANVYAQTRESGDPAIGGAATGGRGTIASGALEGSNVDIAEQFVRMIAAQRAFEANSKTITTADQLLSELIQMKR
jgi:flagellar hook protein FlgE